jgi:dolichol-phosphate mannosyltransferase
VLLGLALFSPVVIWNAQHDWASFRFQFGSRWDPKPLSPAHVLAFVGLQVATATPVLFWAGCRSLARFARRWDRLLTPRYVVTLAFGLPLFLTMGYKSLRYTVHLNWTVPVYLSLLPAASQWLLDRVRQERRGSSGHRWQRSVAWTLVLCSLANTALSVYLLAIEPRMQWAGVFGPWKPLARIVQEYEESVERESGREALVVADGKYRLASILAFYRRPLEADVDAADYTTSQWVLGQKGLGYPYWHGLEEWRGGDIVYVCSDEQDIEAELRGHVERVDAVTDARLGTLGRTAYRIAIGRGLR